MLTALTIRSLADLNAGLNATATVLIVLGLVVIKRRRGTAERPRDAVAVRRSEKLHERLMLAAVSVSALFLVSYVTYHLNAEPVRFQGEGPLRTVYYVVLATHVVLAVVQVPLILMTVHAGLKDRRARHRRLARITAPIWLYVSVTGVAYYVILYWLQPGAADAGR